MKTRDEIRDLQKKIVKHMPGWKFWTSKEYDNSFLIPESADAAAFKPHRTNTPAIYTQLDHNRRLCVSGCWPHSQTEGHACYSPRDVREESPSITCDAARPPEKLAADIARRFLPDYLRIHGLLVEHIAKHDAGTQRQMDVAQQFALIMGDQTKNAHASWFSDACYGHVDVNWGGDSATLELRGNVDILKAALIAAGKAGAFKKGDE